MFTSKYLYSDLLKRQEFQVISRAIGKQTAANRASALRSFLSVHKLTVDDPVGVEMRSEWPEALEQFLESLVLKGCSSRDVSNTKSLIMSWRNAVIDEDSLQAIEADKPTPFQVQLQALMARFPVKLVARTANVPPDMLRGWLQGKRPRASNDRYLHRLETFFAIPRGELCRAAGMATGGGSWSAPDAEAPVIAYRQQLAGRTQDEYWLRPAETSPLRKQWIDFVAYKVALVPSLERSSKAQWRISPMPVKKPTPATWFNFHEGREVPSAGAAWSKVAGFLGWLGLTAERGGKAIPQEQLQTMAWLVDSRLVYEFIQWQKQRAGKLTGAGPDAIGWIQHLMRPEVGYFCQSPWLQATLPESYQHESWTALCERQFKYLSKLAHSLRGEVEVSRDPFEPLMHVVDLAEPLEAVVDMVQRMRADRPIGNPVREAVWARDLALVKLLVSNPLRVRHFSNMTWRPDNTGNLYQRADGSWWVRFKSRYFKNARGAAGDLDYDSPVDDAVVQDLERYIYKHRPRLMRSPTDLLFLSNGSRHDRSALSHSPWRDLSRRIEWLTRRYLWRCPGVGAHAMRQLTGTAIVKASPGEFVTVARVLNDRVATVERHYARFSSADGNKRMSELLRNSFKRM